MKNEKKYTSEELRKLLREIEKWEKKREEEKEKKKPEYLVIGIKCEDGVLLSSYYPFEKDEELKFRAKQRTFFDVLIKEEKDSDGNITNLHYMGVMGIGKECSLLLLEEFLWRPDIAFLYENRGGSISNVVEEVVKTIESGLTRTLPRVVLREASTLKVEETMHLDIDALFLTDGEKLYLIKKEKSGSGQTTTKSLEVKDLYIYGSRWLRNNFFKELKKYAKATEPCEEMGKVVQGSLKSVLAERYNEHFMNAAIVRRKGKYKPGENGNIEILY